MLDFLTNMEKGERDNHFSPIPIMLSNLSDINAIFAPHMTLRIGFHV